MHLLMGHDLIPTLSNVPLSFPWSFLVLLITSSIERVFSQFPAGLLLDITKCNLVLIIIRPLSNQQVY